MYWPGSMGGGSGTQLGGAMGGDTGSWWSLDDGPDSWRPRPAALRDLRIISLRRSLVKTQLNHGTENNQQCCLCFDITGGPVDQNWMQKGFFSYREPCVLQMTLWSFLYRPFFLICSVQLKNSITSYLPSATGGASPISRTVAWNHRDGIGNCLHSRQTLCKCVSLRPFSLWNETTWLGWRRASWGSRQLN